MAGWQPMPFELYHGKFRFSESPVPDTQQDHEDPPSEIHEFVKKEEQRLEGKIDFDAFDFIPSPYLVGMYSEWQPWLRWLQKDHSVLFKSIKAEVGDSLSNNNARLTWHKNNGDPTTVTFYMSSLVRLVNENRYIDDNVIFGVLQHVVSQRENVGVLSPFIFGSKVGHWPVAAKLSAQLKVDVDERNFASMRYLMIPWNIYKDGHWALLVLEPQTHRYSVYDSMSNINGNHRNNLEGWLKRSEIETCLGTAKKSWEYTQVEAAKQSDTQACGAYVCAHGIALAEGLLDRHTAAEVIPSGRGASMAIRRTLLDIIFQHGTDEEGYEKMVHKAGE